MNLRTPSGGPSSARLRRLRPALTDVSVLLVAGTALLTPLASLWLLGLSQVGMTEESTGYRYFNSLRVLYTPDERPWLPQGQIMTVLHLGLQWVLTASGYPVEQLTPRMEVWASLAAGLADATTAVVAVWALRPVHALAGRLLVLALLVCGIFDSALSGGYHLIVPDYHPWIHVVSLMALGLTLRLAALPGPASWRWAISVGVFAGAALSLKVTLAVFVGPPLLLLLVKARSWPRRIGAVAFVGFLTATLLVVFTWASYVGDLSATTRYFSSMLSFASSIEGVQRPPFWVWYLGRFVGPDAGWLTRLAGAAPVLISVGALLVRPRLFALICLPGFVPSLALMSRRDEPTTFIEVFDYAWLALTVWAVCSLTPAIRDVVRRRLPLARTTHGWRTDALLAGAVGVGALLAMLFWVVGALQVTLPTFRRANEVQQALDQFVAEHPGRTAILTLSNNHRPLTRDSAIFKGGIDTAGSSLWGTSPFVASLVPDRHYFFPTPELATPISLAPFVNVLFVSLDPPDHRRQTEAALARTFGASLIGFACPLQMPVSGILQYACHRQPDEPIGTPPREIAFASTTLPIWEGQPVEWRHGARRSLAAGELAYVASSGEIWRMELDGTATRMRGEDGQTIRVSSAGRGERGAQATYRDGRWIVDEQPRPVNRNASLRVQGDGAIRGWDVLDRAHTSVDRRTLAVQAPDLDGWLELTARSAGVRLGVRTGIDRDDLDDGAATVVLWVRAFGLGRVVARVGESASENTVTVARSSGDDVVERAALGRWERLVARLEPDQYAGTRLAVVIELVGAQPGDHLDVGSVEVYAGRYP